MRRRRLVWQLPVANAAVALVVATALGLYVGERATRSCEATYWSKLESAGTACCTRFDTHWNTTTSSQFIDQCRELSQMLAVRVTLILPSGKVIADSAEDAATMDNHHERPEVAAALAGSAGRSIRGSATRQSPYMYLAMPLRHGDNLLAVVRTSLPQEGLLAEIHKVYFEIFIAVTFLVLLIALSGTLILRPFFRSLDDLRQGVDQITQGDWQHRIRSSQSAEIGMLADSLNNMASQLDDRIQKVLRQQGEHQAMLSSMEEGVMAVDRSGTVLSINEPCAALLGVAADKIRGRSVYEALRKPDLLKFIEEAIESGHSLDGDLRFFNPEERWLHAHGTSLHDAGNHRIGVLVVLHDVTRLRHLENVRRDFVANVSHELRTPITSIKGFVETLIDDGFEDRDSAARFLGIVLRQVNRLDAIINDLLLLSRIERGNEDQRIETDAEPLAAALAAARETCEKKARDKSVDLVLDCPADLVAKINAPLLEQAVINLIDNAIKYSDAGTAVKVEAFLDGEQAVIRVIDTGCGIAANHLPRLFERFYRVDRARSRELGGTGLGLAIVKHIIAAHQGTVHVESAVGRGSTFTLRIPTLPPIAGEISAEETDATAGHGRND